MKVEAGDARSRSRFGAIGINILIFFCSTCVALVIAEYVARRYVDTSGWPPYYVGEFENRESDNFVVDEYTGWRMRSGHSVKWRIGDDGEVNVYSSNAQGFRSDKEFSRKGPIVLLGDSFTFGTGVAYENTYGALLENGLNNIPVYNFAMPGFGIDQMWMALKHQATRFDPALVVVAFIDQDFDRSLTAFREYEGFSKPSYVIDDGQLRLRTRDDQPPALIKKLRRNFALASMFSQNMEQLGRHLPLGSWWTINAEIFQQIVVTAQEKGIPVLFVRLPSIGQEAFETLAAQMKAMSAHYLDLHAQLGQYAEAEIFIPGDGHINKRGHQLVAEAIRDWISANPGVIPGG